MEYEYETQFFGFTPESFVDGVHNAVSGYVSDCFKEFESILKSETTISSESNPEELHEACDKMANNVYKTVDEAFDRFEMYVKKNIFKIPPHVLLPEDKVHQDNHFTEEDEKKIDKELEELQRKIKAAKYVNTALKQEIKDLDHAQEQVDKFETQVDALQKSCTDVGGLTQNLAFTCDQAKKVHDLLSNGLESGAFQVHSPSVGEKSSQKNKWKKLKLDEEKL